MIVRRATPEETPELTAMLDSETGSVENCIESGDTYVIDAGEILGFFTITEKFGFPLLQHFCAAPNHRTPTLARALVQSFRRVVSGYYGSKKALVHAPKGRDYIKKMVEYYFKAKPYGESEANYWYMVNT